MTPKFISYLLIQIGGFGASRTLRGVQPFSNSTHIKKDNLSFTL